MATQGGVRAISEVRFVVPADARAHVQAALALAESCIARLAPSPLERRLQLTVEVCRRSVSSWPMGEPTVEQFHAMHDVIAEVVREAHDDEPTMRLPRQRTTGLGRR
jgi:hypothetical protein